MKTSEKPTGLLVATVGSTTRETRLCLENNFDGYPYAGATFDKVSTDWGPGLYEAVGIIGRALRDLAHAPNIAFDPRYIFVCTGDVVWPQGHIAKAIDILTENPSVGIVAGLSVLPVRIEYQDPTPKTTRGDGTIFPLAYEVGKLIPLRTWCFSWTIIRREVLDILQDERLAYSSRAAVELLRKWQVVTERTLSVGRVVGDKVYYPWRAAKKIAACLSRNSTRLSSRHRPYRCRAQTGRRAFGPRNRPEW
jgi:hypothetical protein